MTTRDPRADGAAQSMHELLTVTAPQAEAEMNGRYPGGMNGDGRVSERAMRQFREIWAGDIKGPVSSNLRLWRGMLPERGLSVWYGAYGTTKTYGVIDVFGRMSLGWPAHGREMLAGPVLYVATEDAMGVQNRLAAFKDWHGIGDDTYFPLKILDASLDLRLPADRDFLRDRLVALGDACGEKPAALVIDTLPRAMPGADENSSADMSRVFGHLDEIRSELEMHAAAVHHCGKDRERGPRGHSNLPSAADTIFEFTREDGITNVMVEKQRNGRTGERFSYRLLEFEIGPDPEGDMVPQCVVVPAEPAEAARSTLTNQQAEALKVIDGLLDQASAGGCATLAFVAEERVREELVRTSVTTANSKKSRDVILNRVLRELESREIIRVCDGAVRWAPQYATTATMGNNGNQVAARTPLEGSATRQLPPLGGLPVADPSERQPAEDVEPVLAAAE